MIVNLFGNGDQHSGTALFLFLELFLRENFQRKKIEFHEKFLNCKTNYDKLDTIITYSCRSMWNIMSKLDPIAV